MEKPKPRIWAHLSEHGSYSDHHADKQLFSSREAAMGSLYKVSPRASMECWTERVVAMEPDENDVYEIVAVEYIHPNEKMSKELRNKAFAEED